jgi:pseudaminic acid synthase
MQQIHSQAIAANPPHNPESVTINGRHIGPDHPVYIVAELSANHNQDFDRAVQLVHAAKAAGADAVKLQTYTPDTITIASDRECFRIGGGTLWDGSTLHELYGKAYMPWDWQPKLKKVADELGLDLFSSPFDSTAVEFLEIMNVPAYKLASCELVDLPLIEKIARTGKPLIISTGMATVEEIEEALATARNAGAKQIALLKCTSAYPAPADEINLRTIPELARQFRVPVGLSDHTKGIAVPVAAVALGACIIEKHLTLWRSLGGPDAQFSLEPREFKDMVAAVRTAEKALGSVHFGATPGEESSRRFRRSLFVVQDMKEGEIFNADNVRSIRPGQGLHTRYLPQILGKRAAQPIERGTPLSWDLIADDAICENGHHPANEVIGADHILAK